jgi:hypothetical protein
MHHKDTNCDFKLLFCDAYYGMCTCDVFLSVDHGKNVSKLHVVFGNTFLNVREVGGQPY